MLARGESPTLLQQKATGLLPRRQQSTAGPSVTTSDAVPQNLTAKKPEPILESLCMLENYLRLTC